MTQSASIGEVLSADSCHIVLEASPPDCVEKISRYLDSQSNKDEASNAPAEAESSDSGDSLFITQKPLPEAVRSGKRRRRRVRSHRASSRDLEESEGDTSTSSSSGETEKERRTKKYRLPTYSFPFISGRKWKPRSSLLPVQQNRSLHNFMVGGFFKCVRELWRGNQARDDVVSSLPTVDIDGDYISPLSEEEEEERPEDEDFRVVERKCFVAPSKAKKRRSWCNLSKQEKKQGKAGNVRQVTSGAGRCETSHKTAATASTSRTTLLSLDTESPHGGESSCSVQVERGSHNEAATSDRNLLAQMERAKTERRLPQRHKETLFQAGGEDLDSDSDATVCEFLNVQRSPQQCTQQGGEASTTATDPENDVVHIDDMSPTGQTEVEPESQILFHSLPDLICDTNNDSVFSEASVSKRKKKKKDRDHKSIEEEKDQKIQPEGPHAAKSVEVEETPSLSEQNRTKPPSSQARDENERNERKCMESSSHGGTTVRQEEKDVPHSKQKKKERKKCAADSVRQEVDGHFESGVRMEDSVSCNIENGGKEKKKKKKRKRNDEDVEQLQLRAAAETLNDDDIQMKKNKRKKETIIVMEEGEEKEASERNLDFPPVSTGHSQESEVTEEALESSNVKSSKHKKKRQSPANGEEAAEESTGLSLKNKKKKKTTSDTSEENEKFKDVDNIKKTKEGFDEQNDELLTKKKKKKSEMSSRTMSKDSMTQSDDSVSVRKKEKKRTSSFLVADAEEKDAQTQEEQSSVSQSVDLHVWGAEKPCVSAADFEAESAGITGNLDEANDGVRKKKKKKKREMSVEQDSVEKGHRRDFEEPHKAWPSVLPETTDTGQLVNLMERLESSATSGHCLTDEDVVLKKKRKKKKKEECEDEPRHVQSPSATDHIKSQKSALNTCSLDSHKKKGKHLTFPLITNSRYERSADSSAADHAIKGSLVEQASPHPETPGNQTLNHKKVKKKKKKMKSPGSILPEEEVMTKSADLEPQENKKKEKKERNKSSAVLNVTSSSHMLSETSQISSPDRIMKNKDKTVKRRLHNPSEDFLTDC